MKTKKLDVLGIFAAALCLIHCLIFPLLLVVPLGISHNPYIDLGFLMIGALVVYRITKKIESRTLRAIFWISIGMIAVSIGFDMLFHFHSPLIYIGAVMLIAAHLYNFNSHKH